MPEFPVTLSLSHESAFRQTVDSTDMAKVMKQGFLLPPDIRDWIPESDPV